MGRTEGEVTLSHPQLGSIKGLVPVIGVHQFRSLPYAIIPHRFGDPIIAGSLGADGVFDATKFGPVAPQPDDAEELEFPSPSERIPHEPFAQDEFKCSNLNVTLPAGFQKGLPVMVWFHGGSFMLGAASWPQYGILGLDNCLLILPDFAKFVAVSAENEQPVIGVGVKYLPAVISS